MRFFLLLPLCFFTIFFRAQTIDQVKIDHYLNYLQSENQNIGNLSIFQNGKEVYNRSFGQQNIPALKFDHKTEYHVGSVTKMITATLIWQLIEENKLSLNTKLSAYHPTIPNADKITIQQLLEHRSGLGDFVNFENGKSWIDEKRSEAEIINYISNEKVLFEPGEQYKYSNSAYYLLAKIIEKERKLSFDKTLKKYLLKPFKISMHSENNSKNYFQSYEFRNKGWEIADELNFENVVGVGHLLATPKMLNNFLVKLFDYKLLRKESVEVMLGDEKSDNYGNLIIRYYYDKKFYGHGGTTMGTHSFALYNKEDKIAISYSINGLRYPSKDFLIDLFKLIYENNFKNPIFKKDVSISVAELQKFTGTYEDNESLQLEFFINENQLVGRAKGQPSSPLTYIGDNTFAESSEDIVIRFDCIKNELILTQSGEVMVFKKKSLELISD